jgi:hypothetical protein
MNRGNDAMRKRTLRYNWCPDKTYSLFFSEMLRLDLRFSDLVRDLTRETQLELIKYLINRGVLLERRLSPSPCATQT